MDELSPRFRNFVEKVGHNSTSTLLIQAVTCNLQVGNLPTDRKTQNYFSFIYYSLTLTLTWHPGSLSHIPRGASLFICKTLTFFSRFSIRKGIQFFPLRRREEEKKTLYKYGYMQFLRVIVICGDGQVDI